MRAFPLLILVAGLALPAQPKRAAPHTWAKEPVSFFGVAFGQPLTASIPECEKETAYGITGYTYQDKSVCFRSEDGQPTIWGIDAFPSIDVGEVYGVVGSLSTTFDADSGLSVLKSLVAKFGSPTASRTYTVHNRMGAAFSETDVSWIGKNVWIKFESRGDSVDVGRLSVSTVLSRAKEGLDKIHSTNNLKRSY